MGWEPVLAGALADAAWAAVRDIAAEISVVPVERERLDDVVVFWAYVAGALDDDASAARFEAAVTALVDRIDRGYPGPHLFGGLAGAGWTLAHLDDGGATEVLGAIDAAILDVLEAVDRWTGIYDLIGGLAGHAVYFLERLGSGEVPVARAGLDRIVAHLDAVAVRTEHGTTWHTPPELLPMWQREGWPAGNYNCGVAHGVPGVAAVLARIAALPEPPARAATLYAEAVRWLRAQAADDPVGRFPSMVAPGRRDRARTAWCYGDAGIAAALWASAIRTGTPEAEWRALAGVVAERSIDRSGVTDAGLCHGAIGLAHLCNRYYQASRDPAFRVASIRWFERGLAMRRPGTGIAGFTVQDRAAPGEPGFTMTSHDLLEGAAGIGLGLLAGLRDEPPGWDRLLLCDIPVEAR